MIGRMSVFDEKAADWDTPERRERAHALADIIRAHVPLTPTMRLLDIGAGTGLLGLDLLADVGSVVLADPSEGMIAVARSKIESAGISEAQAIVFDFPATEPPTGAPFDLAVSLLVLHHVQDTEATLRSIHAALAPGGRIGLIDLDKEDGSFHDPDQPGIHHHGFEGATLVATATNAGFEDVHVRNVHDLERDGRNYPLFLLTARKPS
jgi:2-polyprenyl-3-methyl-5-hydroxy-6-metoxy-1,4-benzoquinol methylase